MKEKKKKEEEDGMEVKCPHQTFRKRERVIPAAVGTRIVRRGEGVWHQNVRPNYPKEYKIYQF